MREISGLNLDGEDQVPAFTVFDVALCGDTQLSIRGEIGGDANDQLFGFLARFIRDFFSRAVQCFYSREGDGQVDVHRVFARGGKGANALFQDSLHRVQNVVRWLAFSRRLGFFLRLSHLIVGHELGTHHLRDSDAVADFSQWAGDHSQDAGQAAESAAKKHGLKKRVARANSRFGKLPIQFFENIPGKPLPEHVFKNVLL